MPLNRYSLVGYLLVVAVMLLGACTKLVDGSQKTAEISKEMIDDTERAWKDVFTYRRPKPVQQPQTRYCYTTMSDIVCYDSAQPTLTSHLVGYQDGKNISWVQPGGGSLGVSGGPPVVMAEAVPPPSPPPSSDISVQSLPPVISSRTAPAASGKPPAKSPFHHKESPYVKGKK